MQKQPQIPATFYSERPLYMPIDVSALVFDRIAQKEF
jgi:hypothetical protein